jgi:putative PIN family toxin of toxin-antitoxin system
MLKVVVDTNIIVSALLKTQSNPALIISIILQRNYKLCLSEEIFSEFEEVLARDKFKHLDRLKVKELLSTLKKILCGLYLRFQLMMWQKTQLIMLS